MNRLILSLFILCFTSPAWSDDVLKLQSGETLEGRHLNATEKNPTIYRFETSEGVQVELDAKLVESVEHKGLVVDAGYEKQLEKMGGDTVEGNLKMAQWCLENGSPSRQKVHLRRVLELDPENAVARKKLGYKKMIDGEWRTADEEMTEQGKVRYKGRWISKQEMESIENKRQRKTEVTKWEKQILKWRNDLGGKNDKQAKANFEALIDPMAVPALQSALQTEIKKENRLWVKLIFIKALGRIGSPEALQTLVILMLADPHEEVQMSCLDVLKVRPDKGVVTYLVSRLTPAKSTNAQLNRAAFALGELGDKTVIPALIQSLITEHKYTVSSGQSGQTSVGFGSGSNSSGGGFSFGNSAQTIKKPHQNRSVLDALRKLTGQNFLYDQGAWQNWYQGKRPSQERSE